VQEDPTELFDVLDCSGRKTGEVIARDEAHRTGAWHGAFHCLIIGQREGRGFALFQKRSMAKKIAPGKFDVSVGGHYARGEGAAVAGPREIREELGLDVPFADLLPLGRRVFVYCSTPGVKEQELQDVFLLPRSFPIRELMLQKEEVDGVIEMDIGQGIELFAGKTPGLEIPFHASDGHAERVLVSAGDFVPCQDSYYLKLLLLARRYFSGERELLLI
jgi:isopentenyldiphosphate isomerase